MNKEQFATNLAVNVTPLLEKKGGLSYLSWPHALHLLRSGDPEAVIEWDDPQHLPDGSVMVFCTISAFGSVQTMHLPVMDNRNRAIKTPDSRQISDSMMRCFVKCVACFGIGLGVYAGEDVPLEASGLTEKEVADCKASIDSAESKETLREIWDTVKKMCAAKDDVDNYEGLKNYAAAKAANLDKGDK